MAKYPKRNVTAQLTKTMAGGLSQSEVARLLGISVNAVQQTENRALRKLRMNPAVRRLAVEADVIQVESGGAA